MQKFLARRRLTVGAVLTALAVASPSLSPAQQPRFAEAKVALDNGVIHYRIGGAGPPLLLIHGFTRTGNYWDQFVDDLGQHYNVIVPDLPGHGHSTNPSGKFSFRVTARGLFALLDHLGVDRVLAIGHSAGALTLLHMALEQPARVEAMVLVGGGHRLPIEARKRLREWPDLDSLPPQEQAYYRRVHPGGDSQIRSLLGQGRELASNYAETQFSPEQLATIRARTLIVSGDRDVMFPIQIQVDMYRSIPNAALWVVPLQDHIPLWVEWGGSSEAAVIFPAVVREFFERKQSK